jgi:hypothetical protein
MAKREGQTTQWLKEGQTTQWPKEKDRQHNGQKRSTDNTMANRLKTNNDL